MRRKLKKMAKKSDAGGGTRAAAVAAKPATRHADSAKIVAKSMPRWRVVDPEQLRKERAQRPARVEADAVAPSVREIKNRRFPAPRAVAAARPASALMFSVAPASAGVSDEGAAAPQRLTDVVTVESGGGGKKVRKVVGVRDGKIVWRQG